MGRLHISGNIDLHQKRLTDLMGAQERQKGCRAAGQRSGKTVLPGEPDQQRQVAGHAETGKADHGEDQAALEIRGQFLRGGGIMGREGDHAAVEAGEEALRSNSGSSARLTPHQSGGRVASRARQAKGGPDRCCSWLRHRGTGRSRRPAGSRPGNRAHRCSPGHGR